MTPSVAPRPAAGVSSSTPPAREPPAVDPLNRRLEASLGVVLGALIFAMMVITFVDVGGRYLFNAPISGVYELTTLMLGAVVYLALPLTTLREEHVTISLLSSLFRGRGKRIQYAVLNVLSAAVIGAVAWRLWMQGEKLSGMGERLVILGLPLSPIVYIMSAMALVTAALHLLLALRHLRGRAAPPATIRSLD
jgi:TRAP-type C4-dicarboxylate transport system permease small subunit